MPITRLLVAAATVVPGAAPPPPPTTTATTLGGTGVDLQPSDTALPGSNVIHLLANGVGSWALIAAMLGIVVGAVIWAFGHYSQNYQQAYNGRRGVMVSGLAAVLIGAAPHIITFLFGQGGQAAMR